MNRAEAIPATSTTDTGICFTLSPLKTLWMPRASKGFFNFKPYFLQFTHEIRSLFHAKIAENQT